LIDRVGVINALTNKGKLISIQEGGRWGAENRGTAVNSVIGMIQQYFDDDKNPDPAKVHWVTKLQNLLTNSKTEQSAYDFKQGFLSLSNKPSFDKKSFDKILETCTAIANIQKGHKGYVIVGVCDNEDTAVRIASIFQTQPVSFGGFQITGVEHEAKYLGKSLDELFHMITEKVKNSAISEPLKSYINSHLKCVRYYDSTVFVFETLGQEQPSHYKKKYFERMGTQVLEVPIEKYASLFSRFW